MYASINMSGFKLKYDQRMPNSLEASSPTEHVVRRTQDMSRLNNSLSDMVKATDCSLQNKFESWLVQIKCTHACICIDQHVRIQIKVQPKDAQFT